MRLQVSVWKVLTVEVLRAPSSADYPAFMESLGGGLEGVSSESPLFLLGECVGNDQVTRRDVTGTNGSPELNPSVDL